MLDLWACEALDESSPDQDEDKAQSSRRNEWFTHNINLSCNYKYKREFVKVFIVVEFYESCSLGFGYESIHKQHNIIIIMF